MKTEQLQTFPRDLLEKTDAAKKRYFHDYTIAHPTMNGVRKSLLDAIEDAGSHARTSLSMASGGA